MASENLPISSETIDRYAKKWLVPASNYLAAWIRTAVAVVWGVALTWVLARWPSLGEWLEDQAIWVQGIAFGVLVGLVNFLITWLSCREIRIGNRVLDLAPIGYLLLVNKNPNYQPGDDPNTLAYIEAKETGQPQTGL